MDQLRRVLAVIQGQISRLTVSQKLLIGSLTVVVLMTLFVVAQYAGGREMVELMPGADPEQQQSAYEFLRTANVEHERRDGRVFVPIERKHFILAQMSQGGALPDNTSILFNNLHERQSWTMSSEQTRQLANYALQNELAAVVSQFRGIRSASVIIDAPPRDNLGAAVRVPTASATVFTIDGRPLEQTTVDAIAGLIAGAKAGLDIENVRVIDASVNRQRRARSDDNASAGTYMEQAQALERTVRDKLLELLYYIDGVVVAVNAQVDVRRTTSETQRVLSPGEGTVTAPTEEVTSERSETAPLASAEPGVRSNTGLDLAGASASSTGYSETTTESRLETFPGHTIERIIDPRGMPTKINATVNVPRSYFVRQWRAQSGEADEEAEPTDEQLAPVLTSELGRLQNDLEPLVESPAEFGGVPGAVVVSMIPDPHPLARVRAGMAGGGGVSGAVGGLLASNMAKTFVLGGLALASLGIMALTLRRASKKAELPTPEELVGVPPALRAESDMIGEADEADAALSGIELSSDEIESTKMLEQVSAFVKEEPKEAASLLRRWIITDE